MRNEYKYVIHNSREMLEYQGLPSRISVVHRYAYNLLLPDQSEHVLDRLWDDFDFLWRCTTQL